MRRASSIPLATNARRSSPVAHHPLYVRCHDEEWGIPVADDRRLIDEICDVLKGNKDAHKALRPDAVKFTGIQYKTTLRHGDAGVGW